MSSEQFWERDPKQVARELVMRPVFEYLGIFHIVPHGVITEADAYAYLLSNEGEHLLFTQKAGTWGVFASRRGPIPTITAHARGKTGLITLRKIVCGSDVYGPLEISKMLQIEGRKGRLVGTDSSLYIGESGIELASEGLRVVNELPEGSPENRIAYWKIARR